MFLDIWEAFLAIKFRQCRQPLFTLYALQVSSLFVMKGMLTDLDHFLLLFRQQTLGRIF